MGWGQGAHCGGGVGESGRTGNSCLPSFGPRRWFSAEMGLALGKMRSSVSPVLSPDCFLGELRPHPCAEGLPSASETE